MQRCELGKSYNKPIHSSFNNKRPIWKWWLRPNQSAHALQLDNHRYRITF